MAEGRTCGRCTVCCTVLAVGEIGKPRLAPCAHEVRGGCGIYAERPRSCRTFECTWLLGFGKPAHRPDRSGLMVYGDQTEMGDTFVVTEVRKNAARSPKGQSLMKELRRTGIGLYVRRSDGTTHIEGDDEFVARAQEVVDRLDEERASRVRLKVVG